ncbi:hydroxyacylglutathione hydrolase [Alkalibacterium subtropicum]|uniref:Hydroxyacylglutathione hydrolase n=1 Tax=Alkalibacterium subtropicum TaxID=753702 RepID=A0A1I1K2B4_9LACT|nr:MBL fold metallo-hydrolase [Alkalibacterium subtropicum]SFC55087.1 hydroxyacylglutathione hydrolase [Alkalibacterium subtropicum]
MYFKSFFDTQLAQMAYLVGCQQTGEAIIIDPLRDIEAYIETAEAEGLKITKTAETHIHADFASGLRDVIRKLGAVPYVSDMGGEDWTYQNMPDNTVFLREGDTIKIGNILLDVMHTPGHTPESLSFLLTDKGGGSSVPMGIFSGDFLFVGDVGRPDLLETAAKMEGTTDAGAKDMFRSVQKAKALPDHLQVWPGHGAGSACGKSLGAVPMSTLGYEKENNWAFQYVDEEAFKKELVEDQPEPPHYFAEMKKINKLDVPLASDIRTYPVASRELTEITIDLRAKEVYQSKHAYGTLNIPMNENFLSYAGWFLDYEKELTLIGSKEEADAAARQLQLIGYDKVKGYVSPNALDLETVSLTTEAEEFLRMYREKKQELNILDVRSIAEWKENHLDGAEHILFGDLLKKEIPFDKNAPVFVHCQTGIRSGIALGALEKRGFAHAVNIKGGFEALEALMDE